MTSFKAEDIFDLNKTPNNHRLSAHIEPDETKAERTVRLFKDVVLFIVAVVFLGIIVSFCYDTLQDKAASPDAKRWAMSVLSAATGGIVGFLVRK